MTNPIDPILLSLITTVRESYTIRLIIWLIGPAWQDPLGRTALLTVAAYLIGYSIYGGYFSRFTGGLKSTTLSRLGIDLTDLITLLPMALLTIARSWKAVLIFLVKMLGLAAYLYSPLIAGAFAGALFVTALPNRFDPAFPVAQISLAFFVLVSLVAQVVFFVWPTTKGRFMPWLLLGLLWVILVIAIAVAGIALVSQLQQTASGSPAAPLLIPDWLLLITAVLRELAIVVWLLSLIILVPIVLGGEIAKYGVADKMLSQVRVLVLGQPLPSLKAYEKQESPSKRIPDFSPTPWFLKPSIDVNTAPGIYSYAFSDKSPLYLVDTFHTTSAFYLKPSQGEEGLLITISNGIVYSIALRSGNLE